eukprot:CAMPEP_0197453148 /NCGR_PEP_ID=MMETSP1175-20131217/34117_1 /TAXON_ID=1003142 /ORGANISM="Triceratium dubium, Strain CCMP147" /LENGTH=543 /DNA_ID=CAMNT_0042986347 /DNA_START=184 /DNA_END=1815 /DNA_ORIENTATION=+
MGEPKEIIVVGGGIAGLSTGIYALRNGYKVTIIESHDKTGGQLTAWTEGPYTFDYCLHWLVGTGHGTSNEIWREIGAIQPTTEVINHEVFGRIEDDDLGEFVLYCDMDRWEAYLKGLAPEDSNAIHKLCNMMRQANKADAWSFENPPEFRSLWDYFRAVFKSATFLPVVGRYKTCTCRELMKDLGFQNTRLLGFLDKMFGKDDFPALALIMVMGWQHAKNAGYLKGGSRRMARLITDTYKKLGGDLMLETRVTNIVVEDGTAKGVELENGNELRADYIVSACDGHSVLYDMLGGIYTPPVFKEAYEEWRLFDPWVMVSFGIDKSIVSKAHLTTYAKGEKLNIGRTPVQEYSIMNRSMYDDTFAPKGKTVLLLYFESPWNIWKDLSKEEYAKEKEIIEKQCTKLLEESYAGISEHIEVVDVATPRTEVRYTGVWKGSYEGFFPRMDKLDGLPMELEGLKNFMMVGQWVFPGGGLPPSAQSGRWAIQKLCKKDKKLFKHRVEGDEVGSGNVKKQWGPSDLKFLWAVMLVAAILHQFWWKKIDFDM